MNDEERDDEAKGDEARDDADLNSPQLRSSSHQAPIGTARVKTGLESRRGPG